MVQGSYITPLLITVKVATFATVISLFVGVVLGLVFARKNFWGKGIADTILTLPLVFPPTVMGYYLLVVLGRHGWLGRWLLDTFGIRLVFTWQGAVCAAVAVSFPMVYKAARSAYEGVQRNLEDAARTLGKSEVAVFFQITLPLSWRGILAGAMLAFARSMGEFGATLMVAGNLPGRTQTLSMAIYDAVQSGDRTQGNMLVLITTVVCGIILLGSQNILKHTPWSGGELK